VLKTVDVLIGLTVIILALSMAVTVITQTITTIINTRGRHLRRGLVDLLQQTIGSIDFWQNADKQKRLRGEIKTAIGRAGLHALLPQRERVAVEVMKLAKNRHHDLLKAAGHGH
jgi:hypothetical protein